MAERIEIKIEDPGDTVEVEVVELSVAQGATVAHGDVLPAIAAQVGGRTSIIYDSGVRSGTDVARAIALGADAALAGKAFLWSMGALGEKGPAHMINLFIEELRATLLNAVRYNARLTAPESVLSSGGLA